MRFNLLKFSGWQQFESINIVFHERLTVLTGANGSGKTTILAKILAKYASRNIKSLSTPQKNKETGIVSFIVSFFGRVKVDNDKMSIGLVQYSDFTESDLRIQKTGGPEYNINIENQKGVQCFFVPSHRSIFRYQSVQSISLKKKDKSHAFSEASSISRGRFQGDSSRSVSYSMKEMLISRAIQGFGVQDGVMEIMPKDGEYSEYFRGFQNVLSRLLPDSLGFDRFEIRNQEIVFICNGGSDEFLLEQVSGGISAIIEIAWQIYMYATKEKNEYTVIIDEVENHLHPSLQREILPNLLDAFPKACFIVSTHSPLIVGSVKESHVYALKYNQNGKVVSHKLDLVNKAKTANDILNDVLGIPFTMPVWVEDDLNRIIEKFNSDELTSNTVAVVRAELKELGLDHLMPQVLDNLLEKQPG